MMSEFFESVNASRDAMRIHVHEELAAAQRDHDASVAAARGLTALS